LFCQSLFLKKTHIITYITDSYIPIENLYNLFQNKALAEFLED
jgi:hypothetical protein